MKKRISLFLICCFIISLMSGCKNSNPMSYKEETFNDISYKVPADWVIKVDERTTSETFPWIGYQIGENTCLYIKYQKDYGFGDEKTYVDSHRGLSDFKTYQETSVASKIFQRFSYSVDNANYYEYALGLPHNGILAVGTVDFSGGIYQGDEEIKRIISSIDLSSISSNENALTVSSDAPSNKDPNVSLESSKPSDVIKNLEDPFGGGFPANPSYYPPEEYGEPITTGDFGAAIKNLNDGLIDEGQEVYAYKPPKSEYLEIHFSPSDKAIEEKDNQAVAVEYASMALLIIQNYPDYSDTFGDTISVYLGDSTALITATYRNSVPYTSFFPFSQDSALNANLNLAYDTAFGDYDLSNLTD